MTFFDALLSGTITSFIASVLFFVLLKYFKPKIYICPQISVTSNPNGIYSYRIKIINNRRRQIINSEAELLHRKVPYEGDTESTKSSSGSTKFLPGG